MYICIYVYIYIYIYIYIDQSNVLVEILKSQPYRYSQKLSISI